MAASVHQIRPGIEHHVPRHPAPAASVGKTLASIGDERFDALLLVWLNASAAAAMLAKTGVRLPGWDLSPMMATRDEARRLKMGESLSNAALCRLDALAREFDPHDRRRPQMVDADGKLAFDRVVLAPTARTTKLSRIFASCPMHLVAADNQFFWSRHVQGHQPIGVPCQAHPV